MEISFEVCLIQNVNVSSFPLQEKAIQILLKNKQKKNISWTD